MAVGCLTVLIQCKNMKRPLHVPLAVGWVSVTACWFRCVCSIADGSSQLGPDGLSILSLSPKWLSILSLSPKWLSILSLSLCVTVRMYVLWSSGGHISLIWCKTKTAMKNYSMKFCFIIYRGQICVKNSCGDDAFVRRRKGYTVGLPGQWEAGKTAHMVVQCPRRRSVQHCLSMYTLKI